MDLLNNPTVRIKSTIWEKWNEYSPLAHDVAKIIYNTDEETVWRKCGEKIHDEYQNDSYFVLQSIYYILCWCSDFKEKHQTMRILEHSWNNIGDWVA